jgi:hypothetical protein
MNKTIKIAADAGVKDNLADILFKLGDEDLSGERSALLLRMLLVDKLQYKAVSTNLAAVAAEPANLAQEFAKWNAVDIIAAYHHPDLGLLVANPKIPEELANFGSLRKRELLVVYAGKGGDGADDLCLKAASLAALLFEGAKPKIPAEMYKGKFTVKQLEKPEPSQTAGARKKAAPAGAKTGTRRAASAPVAAAPKGSPRVAAPVVTAVAASAVSKGPVRMTPMYSVAVTNELFHNGNVEAWKRIIASYNASYPELHVYIYYEGERIMDINSLFKWGKVKHGSSIQFAVAGSDIKDVAKLQRYLIQGASHQFEAFLRGSVSNVLKLF